MSSAADTYRATPRESSPPVWTAVGCLVLGAAMQSVVVLPSSWLTIVLAAAATVALAQDRKLGWIPAALVVVVALPFGRGADVAPLMVFDVPVRPQDPAIIIALAAGAWAAAHRVIRGLHLQPVPRMAVAAHGAFMLVGAAALVIGVVRGHEVVDILRDVRWWGLYLIAPLAILAGVRRAELLRALLVGISLFAVLVVLTAVLPRFDGALKDQIYTYDRGLLRLQFGNSMLLLPAVAYVLWRTLRQPSAVRMGWLALLVGAQLLSLTRVSVFMTLGVAVAVLVLHLRYGRAGRGSRWRSAGATAVVLAASVLVAVGLSTIGSGSTDASGRAPENPIERIAFLGSESDFGTTIDSISSGGRFSTYFNAIEEISHSPVLGGGLGQLVDVRFAFNEARSRTIGTQPGVDDAYLTVGLKAGAIGMAVFGGLLLLSLRGALRPAAKAIRWWYVPAWVGVLGLTLTQGFAVSSYGPLVLAALATVPFLGYAATSRAAATGQA